MRIIRTIVYLLCLLCVISPARAQEKKLKIFIVSSYHRDYLWTQDTNLGECAAMLDFKFLDDKADTEAFTANDFVEGKRTIVKKAWMDTKRKNTQDDIIAATAQITAEIKAFDPDIIMLGDDNAANHIGNQFIDSSVPVVFWGINGLPLKYGLIDSLEHPGHNVTGVYQSGYPGECLDYLVKLCPGVKTFAVVSDDSETGRSKAKNIENLDRVGELSAKLSGVIITNSFSEWKSQLLALSDKVDAFFVVNHNTLKDDQGVTIDPLMAASWYLRNIMKPECADEKQFTQAGFLLAVDDSGYKQGYEAMKLAYEILIQKKDPASMPVHYPSRGAIIVNKERARALGIDLAGKDFIEETVDDSLALKAYPQ